MASATAAVFASMTLLATPVLAAGCTTTAPTPPRAQALAGQSATSYAAPGTSARSAFWQGEQEPALGKNGAKQTDRIRVVGQSQVPGTGAARPRGSALRVELRPYETAKGRADGDVTNTGGYLANRSELYGRAPAKMSSTPASQWPDPEGSERWYNFPVLIPEGFVMAKDTTWLDLVQWKGYKGGSPPIAIEIKRDRFRVGGANMAADLGKVKPGQWTQLTVGIRFSSSASQGWVEVWRDGSLRLPRKAVATMGRVDGRVDPTYLKQGIYRSKAWSVTHVAWFGDTTVATSRSALASLVTQLQPAVAPAPPTPAAWSASRTSGVLPVLRRTAQLTVR